MAVGFDTVAFRIVTDDSSLPQPESAEYGAMTYTARLRLSSAAVMNNLRALQSVFTEKPALGYINGGTIVIEAGVGTKTLTIPTPNGGERAYVALLESLTPVAHMHSDSAWLVDATFRILDDV